jgi:histidine ammonia-lyase
VTVVVNTRADFTLENFRRVAYGGEGVEIGPGAVRAMGDGRAAFMALLESDRTQFIYGTTSRGGPAVRMVIPPDEQRQQARGRGGLGGRGFGGGYLDEAVVRGIVFARLANFVSGHAKVRPVVAERMAAILDGPIPKVPLDGQVGAGEILPMFHVLAGFPRGDLEEAEGMALSNGSPCAAALAADTALIAPNRLENAEAVFALSIEAFRAPLSAYDETLDDLWGDEEEATALRTLRKYLEGAESESRRFHQAPVSYRILPRVLGQTHRAIAAAEKAATVSLRSVTDNPLYVFADESHPFGRAFSTGGYHNAMSYPALNALSVAWAELALLAERQVTALNTTEVSELPRNLALAGAGGLGTYAYGWAASGYVEEARAAATPALLPAAVNDSQDDVSSPTFSAYARQRRAAECLDGALTILAIVSSQALFVTDRSPAPGIAQLLQFVRSVFPPIDGRGTRDYSAEGGRLQRALGNGALSGQLVAP